MKTALITGANGQDGILLSRHLLGLGYTVHGTVRGADRKVEAGVTPHVPGEPSAEVWADLIGKLAPTEIYLLGADSFAGAPLHGISNLLSSNVMLMAHQVEAAAISAPQARVFIAGSAAVFGDPACSPQTENTLRTPNTLYGASKALLHPMADLCRRRGQFVAIGILFNHESPLRPERFVTRKITAAAARIAAGSPEKLKLGNLDVVRDWGHAKDYVRAMHLLLRMEEPGDYVIASGEGHTVREFCATAFGMAGLDYRDHVVTAPEFWRPAEQIPLIGNPARLEQVSSWRRNFDFQFLVREMVLHDMDLMVEGVVRE